MALYFGNKEVKSPLAKVLFGLMAIIIGIVVTAFILLVILPIVGVVISASVALVLLVVLSVVFAIPGLIIIAIFSRKLGKRKHRN